MGGVGRVYISFISFVVLSDGVILTLPRQQHAGSVGGAVYAGYTFGNGIKLILDFFGGIGGLSLGVA